MHCILHADDMGLCPASDLVFKKILEKGICRSVSLLPNMSGFKESVIFLREHPEVYVSVHLNLIEGSPISGHSQIRDLVNSQGTFNKKFAGLWGGCILHGKKMVLQIQKEIEAQVQKVRVAFGPQRALSLDGHMHTHVLPPVYDILPEIMKKYDIDHLRIPHEPLNLGIAVKNMHLGLVKNILLNILSSTQSKERLRRSDHVIGVLHSGRMTRTIIACDIKKIPKKSRSVEIIMHPAFLPNTSVLPPGDICGKFYTDFHRNIEAEILLNGLDAFAPSGTPFDKQGFHSV